MTKPPLLVVDDDEQIRKQLRWALGEEYRVLSASCRVEALELFREHSVRLVLLDLGLPPHPRDAVEGLRTLDELRQLDPVAKVIIVSGNSERKNAIRAVEQGAYDIFPKPVDIDQLKVVLTRVHQRIELESESAAPADAAHGEGPTREETASLEETGNIEPVLPECQDIIGSSEVMRDVFKTVRKVAATDVPVLIHGESGTGKERIAQALHQLSQRADGPFVAINCGAIPESLFESELFGHEKGAFTGADETRKGRIEYANGGTLFLDEVGELPLAVQVKLLRFLQEHVIERVGGREPIPVDGRILAATNIDLPAAVSAGTFREDLFYRLEVVHVEVPALRDRGDDVLHIAEHFVRNLSEEYGKSGLRLSADAIDALLRHPWAGNVRELQNKVRRAVVLVEGQEITAADLSLDSGDAEAPGSLPTLKEAKETLEREYVERALAANKGNISRTARELGISRPTLYELISRYKLQTNS